MVAVVLVEDAQLHPAQLIEHLQSQMAHFMVPRYVRILKVLPRTPTNKVKKHQLRGEGVTADTWDREAAGITIKRDPPIEI